MEAGWKIGRITCKRNKNEAIQKVHSVTSPDSADSARQRTLNYGASAAMESPTHQWQGLFRRSIGCHLAANSQSAAQFPQCWH